MKSGASAEWALTASKLRFGPEARIEDRGDHPNVEGLPRYAVILGDLPLGAGITWEDAFRNAHERNTHIPQPAPEVFYKKPPPAGEEFIEEFVGVMRQRDIYTEFLIWYGKKSDEDSESYPRALQRKEWLEQLGTFIAGLDE
jgi:hypothetical protein